MADILVVDDDQSRALAASRVELVGETPAMLDIYKVIGRLAATSVPALIMGERGTGKRRLVETIHKNSTRRQQPLVSIDCAGASHAEIGAQLFGQGRGTVVLSGIDRLPMSQQSRIAQALTARRTRGSGPRLTARILATSDHDLADDAVAGTFHRELYDEIAVITVRVPPLRDRRDDIPLHVRQFIQEFNAELMQTIRGVEDPVARMLAEHSWPGNLCELKRVIKRACIIARGDIITAEDIGDSLIEPVFPGRPLQETALVRSARAALHDRLARASRHGSAYHDIVDVVETTLVAEALTLTNGNQAKAADLLGVDRATLRKKMPAEN